MPLKVVTDSPGQGVYVGGFTIAPEVLLIRADSFESAWEVMCETFAEAGSIAPCDVECGDVECDGCDHVDGFGACCTLDLTMRVVRPGRTD